ncbi:hypothetical protein LIER_22707 [Lithospermum erythrorhizon]|uniref:Uncharacterized protein n=1 Tax=Lithospermum erythrorhizon TaxID=34254 RepID=A0AAV3QV13_LITER
MCTDFTNINEAFSEDCYPLPNIDGWVDSSARYQVVDFLDAFRGYHQIFMAEENVEKTAFVTETEGVPAISPAIGTDVAGDVLQLYLAVSESALSSFLIREEERVQRPVYYVSWVMRGAETMYLLTEKLVFSPIVDYTPLEWAAEEAFRTKEVIDNAPEGGGSTSGPWCQDILEFLR